MSNTFLKWILGIRKHKTDGNTVKNPMTRVSWSLTSLFSTNMAISETTNDKKPIYCAFRADWQPFWILQLPATRVVCQLVADQF